MDCVEFLYWWIFIQHIYDLLSLTFVDLYSTLHRQSHTEHIDCAVDYILTYFQSHQRASIFEPNCIFVATSLCVRFMFASRLIDCMLYLSRVTGFSVPHYLQQCAARVLNVCSLVGVSWNVWMFVVRITMHASRVIRSDNTIGAGFPMMWDETRCMWYISWIFVSWLFTDTLL